MGAIRWMPRRLRPLVTCALLLAAPGIARALPGVEVAILPATSTVVPGSEFDLEIRVTSVSSAFNGFNAVIGYDPAALTFLPTSPVALQQGCLLTGECSAACGNTFHQFSYGGDTLKVSDVLLCNQITLAGPGQIYKLHFRASDVVQVTTLTLRKATFVNAGLYVQPVTRSGCQVGIGVNLGVDPELHTSSGLRLMARPNPARGPVSLSIESDAPGDQSLQVIDLLGRTIRKLPSGWTERGTRRVEWDGRDESGSLAPTGVYLIRLRMGDRARQTRVMLLR